MFDKKLSMSFVIKHQAAKPKVGQADLKLFYTSVPRRLHCTMAPGNSFVLSVETCDSSSRVIRESVNESEREKERERERESCISHVSNYLTSRLTRGRRFQTPERSRGAWEQ